MEVRLVSDAEAESWNVFVDSHPFGRSAATSVSRGLWAIHSWTPSFVGLFSDGALTGGAVLVTKPVCKAAWKIGRIECIMPDSADVAGSTRELMSVVENIARRQRCLEIEVRVNIPDDFSIGGLDYAAPVREALAQLGYRPIEKRGATYLVRIDMDDEALLGSLGSKCRRDARKGLREGVTVSETPGQDDFRQFCQAHHAMGERKGLTDIGESVYDAYWPLVQHGYLRLFRASHEGQVCNMALIDSLGMPRYLMGAAMPAAYERGRPPSGQALHYQIMCRLRDRSAKCYDLGGSPGPTPQEGHPNFTVWRFKHEFGAPYVYMIHYHRKALSLVGSLAMGLARKLGYLAR